VRDGKWSTFDAMTRASLYTLLIERSDRIIQHKAQHSKTCARNCKAESLTCLPPLQVANFSLHCAGGSKSLESSASVDMQGLEWKVAY
jgi:hypothetical protein